MPRPDGALSRARAACLFITRADPSPTHEECRRIARAFGR